MPRYYLTARRAQVVPATEGVELPISDWFSAREQRKYVRMQEQPIEASEVPDGVWVKCEDCGKIALEREVTEDFRVCRHCGSHFDLTLEQRIDILVDEGSFVETEADIETCDPLGFVAAKPYIESVETAKERTGHPDAVATGRARIGGHEVVVGVMDFRFIGASMGSVVGEKVTRAFELALAERLPIVLVTASGGARMQEGVLSLMQMAKTAAAARRHADAGLPSISVLSNPTFGGVTASFATLADIVLAEPGALVGFTGARVIEQTIRQKLPKGFQTSEFMLDHGLVDEVVPRGRLSERIALLLDYMRPRERSAS